MRLAAAALLPLSLSFAVESALAAHPLFTDDSGVQGANKLQIEAVPESAKDDVSGETVTSTSLGLAYGVVDTVDVFVGIPYITITSDTDETSGIGDSQAGIKWRFYERESLSFALKPAVSFATGDENKGLGTGKTGYSLFASGTYESGPWTVNAQAGWIHAPDTLGSPADSAAMSIGGWYEIQNMARLVLDYGYITNPDSAVSEDYSFAIAGVIFMVSEDLDIDVGYRKGLSEIETDSTIMFGITARY